MLVSGVRGSCAPIQHLGLRLALDDAYSLWRLCNFELVFVHLCSSLHLLAMSLTGTSIDIFRMRSTFITSVQQCWFSKTKKLLPC